MFYLLYIQIAQISGASVTTRGRYMTEDELSREEPGYSVSYLVLLCSGLVMSKLVMGQVLSLLELNCTEHCEMVMGCSSTMLSRLKSWPMPGYEMKA